jgi:hypothetical protein
MVCASGADVKRDWAITRVLTAVTMKEILMPAQKPAKPSDSAIYILD